MKKYLINLVFVSCQTSQISRPIPMTESNLQAKNISKAEHPLGGTQQLFVEKTRIQIKKKSENNSGSLFAVQSPNAFLFSKKIPLMPGDFLTLNVEPVSSTSNPKSPNAASKSGESGSLDRPKDLSATDALTDELTSALPNLGPDDGSNGKVLSQIQAEVVDRTPEGDLIVRAERSSSVDGRNKNISFEAVIPARIVSDSNTFSTKDLRSVKFAESGPETIRRTSTNWNDEYSLRYSGFSETGSKNARQLADDKKKLQDVRDRLEGKIKSFAADRSRFAKERTKFLDERSSLDSKLLESERLLKDKEAYIAKLEAEQAQAKTTAEPANAAQDRTASNGGGSGSQSSQAPATKLSGSASEGNPSEMNGKKGDPNVAKQ